MGNSKEITIKTEGGDVVVRKLALRDYATLLRAIKELPGELGKFVGGADKEELTTEFVLRHLPELLADHLDELAAVVAVATDKESEFFMDAELADFVEVVAAVFELNNYQKLMTTVKKLMAGKDPASPNPVQNGSGAAG